MVIGSKVKHSSGCIIYGQGMINIHWQIVTNKISLVNSELLWLRQYAYLYVEKSGLAA